MNEREIVFAAQISHTIGLDNLYDETQKKKLIDVLTILNEAPELGLGLANVPDIVDRLIKSKLILARSF